MKCKNYVTNESMLEPTVLVVSHVCCTCVSSSENWGSLLSSTRFSQVMSVIHLHGFGGQAFMSRAAPPILTGEVQDSWLGIGTMVYCRARWSAWAIL